MRQMLPEPARPDAGQSDAGRSTTQAKERAPFTSLWAWYRPYVRGSRGRLALTLVAAAVVLACQAVIPLQVDALLSLGALDTGALLLLVGLVCLQVIVGYAQDLGARDVSNDSALRLRRTVFDRLLTSRAIRRNGLVRSSVVSRHTTDVDHISEALEQTLVEGLPGSIRIVQSLILLTWIDWRAGLVMAVATSAFLVIRRIVGTRLFDIDRARLDASSRVGESVDEAISASRLISGLQMDAWCQERFATRAEVLRTATRQQAERVAQLVTSARAAGLAGLLAVVVFGLVIGGQGLGSVAAALLYVEGVVRGLEALPGWLRSLQMAVISRRRIDQILDEPLPLTTLQPGAPVDLTRDVIASAEGGMVGLVTPAALEPDAVLTVLSAAGDPDPWRVTLEGYEIRRPGVGSGVIHVPADSVAFNASLREHLQRVSATDDDSLVAALAAVGLGYLADPPLGLDVPLGPVGSLLTVDEQQRLALATALAGDPELLLVGPLLCLADTDTAQPILAALRRRTGLSTTVVAVRTADLAQAMDSMLFVTADGAVCDTHQDLLVAEQAYAALWERRLNSEDVDLSVLGLGDAANVNLYTRLVTEQFAEGDVIYRQGSAADRLVFVIAGHVEITTDDGAGNVRRVARIGPGNHCGDLRLTVGERRAETARAIDSCVVRTLSRDAISAGLTGLLDRSPTERRIVTTLLKEGPMVLSRLHESLEDISPGQVDAALALLVQDGAIRMSGDSISAVTGRARRAGSAQLLDMLADM